MNNDNGYIIFKSQSITNPIKVTNARALTIALSDNIGEAIEQGTLSYLEYFKKLIAGDRSCSDKNLANAAVYNSIANNDKNILSKGQVINDIVQATSGTTASKVINKFINFVKLRNRLGTSAARLKFRAVIKENISPFGIKNYQIVFSIKDDKQIEGYVNRNIENLIHNRHEEVKFNITADEALFLTDYVDDAGNFIEKWDGSDNITPINPLQISMQYMLYVKTPIDISTPKKKIIEFKTIYKDNKGEVIPDLVIDRKYIRKVANTLSNEFNSPNNIVNITYNKNSNSDTATIKVELAIDCSNKIEVQYKETFLGTGFRRSPLIASKIIKEQSSILFDTNLNKAINSLRKTILKDKIDALANDRGQNIFDHLQSTIVNYTVRNSTDYKFFLRNNENINLQNELKLINEISKDKSFDQNLVTRLKHIDAQAAALHFFIKHDKNKIIKTMEKLGIESEVLIIELIKKLQIETSNANEQVNFINNYANITRAYASENINVERYHQFSSTFRESNTLSYSNYLQTDSEVPLAFYMHEKKDTENVKKINQFFRNLNINQKILPSIYSLYKPKSKSSVLTAINSVICAKDIISIISKETEVDHFSAKSDFAILELIASKHPELDCFGIQNPERIENIAYAIRDNAYGFNRYEMVDTKNIESYSSQSTIERYKTDMQYLNKKLLDQIIQRELDICSIDGNPDTTSYYTDEEDNSIETYDVKSDNSIDIEYDDIKSDDSIHTMLAKNRLNKTKNQFNPLVLTERITMVGDREVTHDQLYIEKLKQFYILISIFENEIPQHPLDKDGNLDSLIVRKLKIYIHKNYGKYREYILNKNYSGGF